VTAPYCGFCGHHVAPENDHVKVESERVRTDDRNTSETYYLHPECADDALAGWVMPA